MGILEPSNSRLRKKKETYGNSVNSDSEGEEVTLQENVFNKNEKRRRI